MKKLFFLFLAVLIFTGCSFLFPKEDEVFVVEVIVDSNVTVTPMRAELSKGESVVFTYTLKEGYILNSITVDGVSIVPFGNTFSISNVTSDKKVNIISIEKKKFTISASAGPNGTVSPAGEILVTEGQSQTINITANPGFLQDMLKINGTNVSLTSSYTFSNVTADASLHATFKKDSILWPLLNIIWRNDSVYIDSSNYYFGTEGEILNYSANGTYIVFWKNTIYNRVWTLDKSKYPAVITYGGRLCKIEKINEEKFVFSYINELNQKVTQTYVNHGYK